MTVRIKKEDELSGLLNTLQRDGGKGKGMPVVEEHSSEEEKDPEGKTGEMQDHADGGKGKGMPGELGDGGEGIPGEEKVALDAITGKPKLSMRERANLRVNKSVLRRASTIDEIRDQRLGLNRRESYKEMAERRMRG